MIIIPYARITNSHNLRQSVFYCLHGDGHDGSEFRNKYVSTVNLLPGVDPYPQMEELRKYSSYRNTISARRLIISFSEHELDPADENSAVKAVEIGRRVCEEYYPGHAFLICCQQDGKSGLVHLHMISPNCSVKDHKGFDDLHTKHYYLKKAVDTVSKEYFELDKGQYSHEKVSLAERARREENAARIFANQKTADENKIIEFMNSHKAKGEAKTPLLDTQGLKYIWKDDLKARIRVSMKGARSHEGYLERLEAHGVEGTFKNTKKYGDFILYELKDTSNFPEGEKIPSNLKSKSYKLGNDFGVEALDDEIHHRSHSNQIDKDKKPEIVKTSSENISVKEPEHVNPYQAQIDALRAQTDALYNEYNRQTREYYEESRLFFRWCIENDIDFGQGASFDEKAHAAARKKYKKHLEDERKKEYIEHLKETGEFPPEDENSPIPVPVLEEDESEEEISDDYITEEPDDFEPDLSELDLDLEDNEGEDEGGDEPKRSARVQAMIDALHQDAEAVTGGREIDDTEFGE